MLAPSQTVACIMCVFQLMLLTPVTRRRKHIFKYALYAGDATLDSLARARATADEGRASISNRASVCAICPQNILVWFGLASLFLCVLESCFFLFNAMTLVHPLSAGVCCCCWCC